MPITKIDFPTLGEWFGEAHPPITSDYNPPTLSDLRSTDPVYPIPPPQTLYDLASYRTPFAFLFNRPRTKLVR